MATTYNQNVSNEQEHYKIKLSMLLSPHRDCLVEQVRDNSDFDNKHCHSKFKAINKLAITYLMR